VTNTEKVGTQKVLEVEESLWEKGVGKNASAKGLGSRNRVEERIYPKEKESVLVVKRGKRGGTSICRRSAEKGIHLTIQVTLDIASTFCSKKGWEAKNGTRLSPHKSVDDKKRISFTPHR